MSDHMAKAIEELESKLQGQNEAAKKTKRAINTLCEAAGVATRYPDVDVHDDVRGAFRNDQFYGQPLASSVRSILELRKKRNMGTASVNAIYDELVSHGFEFETKDEGNAKRGLRISLRKNSTIFHRIKATGEWGLLEWYPNAKPAKDDDDDDEKPVSKSATAAVENVAAADDKGARTVRVKVTETSDAGDKK